MEILDKIRDILDIRDFKIILENENNGKHYIHCTKLLIVYAPEESSISISFNTDLRADSAVLLTLHIQSEITNKVTSLFILDSYIYDEELNYLTGEIAYQKMEQFKKNSYINDFLINEQADEMIKYGKAFNA